LSADYGVVIARRGPEEVGLAETLLQFQALLSASDGQVYRVRACGGPMPDGMWQGWLEFDPVEGGTPLRSQRETTQPNRADTEYWASGLTPVYLEGALDRTLSGPVRVPTQVVRPPAFDGPAPSATIAAETPSGTPRSILDPFSVYEKGEPLLRKQLAALSAWHLVNIVVEYELSDESMDTLNAMPAGALVDLIVSRVREESVPDR
jgi:hypothetical protein